MIQRNNIGLCSWPFAIARDRCLTQKPACCYRRSCVFYIRESQAKSGDERQGHHSCVLGAVQAHLWDWAPPRHRWHLGTCVRITAQVRAVACTRLPGQKEFIPVVFTVLNVSSDAFTVSEAGDLGISFF